MGMIQRYRFDPSPFLVLSCELSVSEKGNPDKRKYCEAFALASFIFEVTVL